MKRQLLAINFFVFIFCGNLSALSLEEAITKSLANNLSLKIEDSSLSIAEEGLLQSKVDFLPTIVLSGSLSETETAPLNVRGLL